MEVVKEDIGYCGNCKKTIENNYSIHRIHCMRHIVLCEYCDEPIPRSEMDDHLEEDHKVVVCDWCNETMEKYQIEQHKEEACPERGIHCTYCDLEVKASSYSEHVASCGSRTDVCLQCKNRIMLRDMENHLQYDCVKKIQPKVNRHKLHNGPRLAMDGETVSPIPDPVRPVLSSPMRPTPAQIRSIPDPIVRPIPDFPMRPTPAQTRSIPDPIVRPAPDPVRPISDSSVILNPAVTPIPDPRIRPIPMSNHQQIRNQDIVNDEELAYKLQQEYNLQSQTSLTDAEIARHLGEDHTNILDSVLNDPNHAHQLYNQLDEVHNDGILAHQLQHEETLGEQGVGSLSTMMIYDRALLQEKQEEERIRQLEIDREIAVGLEDLSLDTVKDTPTVVDTPTIPCDLCGDNVEFDHYQYHLEKFHHSQYHFGDEFQSHDESHDYSHSIELPSSSPTEVLPDSPPHVIRGHGVSISSGDNVKCQYCGVELTSHLLSVHEVSCSSNPETEIGSVYLNHDSQPNDSTNTIPCEFCGEDVSVNDFNDHEVECQLMSTNKQFQYKEEQELLPCTTCGNTFPLQSFHTHQAVCELEYNRSQQREQSFVKEYHHESDTLVSCQYCGLHLAKSLIADHEKKHNIISTNERPPHRFKQHTRLITTLPQTSSTSREADSLSLKLDRQYLSSDLKVEGKALHHRNKHGNKSYYGVHVDEGGQRNTRRRNSNNYRYQ